MSKKPAFITVKDQKSNFENNTQCSLINPAKNHVGRISKKLLASIKKNYVKPSNSLNGNPPKKLSLGSIISSKRKTNILFNLILVNFILQSVRNI